MTFWETPVTALTESDLQSLVDDGIREGDRLEFKRDMYPSPEKGQDPRLGSDKKEMLRDIIALANHRGGRLLIGVDEAENDGTAADLVGIPRGVPPHGKEDWDTWVRKQCRANIEEPVIGLQVVAVSLEKGTEVIVVEVPESAGQPHMLTLDKLNQCWKREGREKHAMSIDEIRESVERSSTNRGRIERFIAQRKQDLLASLKGRPAAMIWGLPAYFDEDADHIDLGPASFVRRLMTSPPVPEYTKRGSHTALPTDVSMLNPYRILEGLRGDRREFDSEEPGAVRSLEVHRNGYVEYIDPLRRFGSENAYTLSHREAWSLISLISLVRGLYNGVLEGSPVMIGMIIVNAAGTALLATRDEPQSHTRVELNLGTRRFDRLDPEDKSVIQWFMDRLWQSFGLEEARVFDGVGDLITRSQRS